MCTSAESIAFFVNVYNALIIHGTVILGTPTTLVKRLNFFGDIKYRIGSDFAPFTANDIEHGILRNNAISPASFGSIIGFKVRRPLALESARAAWWCMLHLNFDMAVRGCIVWPTLQCVLLVWVWRCVR